MEEKELMIKKLKVAKKLNMTTWIIMVATPEMGFFVAVLFVVATMLTSFRMIEQEKAMLGFVFVMFGWITCGIWGHIWCKKQINLLKQRD